MAMIKCPECGERISSMAMTCPHCGVAIKGHLYKCPECGEYVLDSNKECPECGVKLNFNRTNNVNSQSQNNNTQEENPETETPDSFESNENETQLQQSDDHRNVYITIIVVFIVMCCAGIYLYNMYAEKREQDYLEEMEAKRQQEILDEQEKMKADHEDSLDWERAKLAQSEEALERYKQCHEDGIFLDSADILLRQMAALKVTDEDMVAVRNVLEERLELVANDPASKKDADVLGIHYQIEGPVNINRRFKSDGIRTEYVVSCSVNETITRSDPTKPTQSMHTLRAVLSSDKEITDFKL